MVNYESAKGDANMNKKEVMKDGAEIVARSPQLFIDVDIEADGIAGNGSMLSIGAKSVTGDSYYTEIKPSSDDFIPANKDFCEQHGLSRDRLLEEAPDLMEAMTSFYKWIEEQSYKSDKQPVFTAFNAAFDWAFVDLYFKKANLENPFGIAPFDLKSLAMALDSKWDWRDTRKDNLPEIIKPDRKFTHNALDDAEYQQEIHFAMAGLLARQNQQ